MTIFDEIDKQIKSFVKKYGKVDVVPVFPVFRPGDFGLERDTDDRDSIGEAASWDGITKLFGKKGLTPDLCIEFALQLDGGPLVFVGARPSIEDRPIIKRGQ